MPPILNPLKEVQPQAVQEIETKEEKPTKKGGKAEQKEKNNTKAVQQTLSYAEGQTNQYLGAYPVEQDGMIQIKNDITPEKYP